jgi:hypothetical protein
MFAVHLYRGPSARDDTAVTRDTISLFDNERDANLKSSVEMVEGALIELGHIVADARREHEHSERCWHVEAGSAQVDIYLIDAGPLWTLRVSAAVMTPGDDTDRAALFRSLLEKNASEVTGVAFALEGETVMLVAERSTVDLDPSEVTEIIGRVEKYADTYDDALVEEFGGTRGAAPA